MSISKRGYKEYTLDNGLVVALQNIPTSIVSAELLVEIGPLNERKGEEGISHFLEHCLYFGGSEKYSPVEADQVRAYFGVFESFQAFTSTSMISFIGHFLKEHSEIWLDYIADHAFRPRLNLSRVESEREIVLGEIHDEKSSPDYSSDEEFKDLFYRGHPKGISIFGKEEVIAQLNVSKLAEFHSRGFKPNNLRLIMAGGLPNNIEKIIDKYFGKVPAGNFCKKDFDLIKPLKEKNIVSRYSPELVNPENVKQSSAKLTLASICPPESSSEIYALKALAQILGGGTNSLLHYNLRLDKRLAYYIGTYYNGDDNCGELRTVGDVPAKKICESIDAIFEEFDSLKNKKVSSQVLDGIKNGARYYIQKARESNVDCLEFVQSKLFTQLTHEAYLTGHNKLTPKKIQEVANKYLPDRENGKYVLYIRDPLKK